MCVLLKIQFARFDSGRGLPQSVDGALMLWGFNGCVRSVMETSMSKMFFEI